MVKKNDIKEKVKSNFKDNIRKSESIAMKSKNKIKDYFYDAEEYVRKKPMESILFAIVMGLLIGMSSSVKDNSRRQKSYVFSLDSF